MTQSLKKQALFAGPADHSQTDGQDLSVAELQRQQQEIERQIREKQEATKRSVIDQIVQVVNQYDIPIEDLVEALGGEDQTQRGQGSPQIPRSPNRRRLVGTWQGTGLDQGP